MLQCTAAAADFLDDRACGSLRRVHNKAFNRFALHAVDFAVNNARLGDGEFVALTAHVFNQDRQMQFAASADLERIRAVSVADAQRNVRLQFAHQARAQVTARDISALTAREGGIVDLERHRDGRLADFDERQTLDALRRADGVTDGQIRRAGQRHDVAHADFFRVHTLQAVVLIQVAQTPRLARHAGLHICVDDVHARLEHAAGDAADADAPDILGVVDGGNQHLRRAVGIAFRRGNVFQDGIEQRAQIRAGGVQIQRCRTLAGGNVENRVFDGALVGFEVNQQVEDFAHHLFAARVGAVNLVDDNQHLQLQLQCLFQHEAGLGHRAFKAVHQQQHAVHHFQHAFHFAAEVRVTGGVDDVDFRLAVMHSGVLRQNRDAALALDGAGVHYAVNRLLILMVNAALLEHLVNQRRLAVVNVGDNCNVTNIFTNHNVFSPSI